MSEHFPEFYRRYPNKAGKKDAEKKWKAKNLDEQWDRISKFLDWAPKHDERWKKGYIPMASTFVNQERWNDHDKHMYPPRLTATASEKPIDTGPECSRYARYANLFLLKQLMTVGGLRNDPILGKIVQAKNEVVRQAETEGDWEDDDFTSVLKKTILDKLNEANETTA